MQRKTHMKVNNGDTTAPYCAARADEDSSPFVVGERHRIQIPHQQSILKVH